MILGGVNVGATCFGLYLVEAAGRRVSLMTGALFQACCFLVFASIGHFAFLPAQQDGDMSGQKSYGAVMIVFACLFICSFASTWGPMTWAVVGEM
jgi:SP family sugar:H+ symporter-like MFS transporter